MPNDTPEFSHEDLQGRLNDYFAVRGHVKGKPYDVVTRSSRDEALAVCEQTGPQRGVGDARADGTRDQGAYLDTRLAADNWTREKAEAAGVRIDDRHPVHFAFTLDPKSIPYPEQKPGGPVMDRTEHPAAKFDLSNWSFTIDDSVSQYNLVSTGQMAFGEPAHPLHRQVMNARQLADAIEKHETTYGAENPRLAGKTRIEAQMWATKPTFRAVPLPEARETSRPSLRSVAELAPRPVADGLASKTRAPADKPDTAPGPAV